MIIVVCSLNFKILPIRFNTRQKIADEHRKNKNRTTFNDTRAQQNYKYYNLLAHYIVAKYIIIFESTDDRYSYNYGLKLIVTIYQQNNMYHIKMCFIHVIRTMYSYHYGS